MNLNYLLSPRSFIGYTLLNIIILMLGVVNIWSIGFLVFFAATAYFLNFPSKNIVYEKDNILFPFTAVLADQKELPVSDDGPVVLRYKIPFWKLRTTLAFPMYSELVLFEKSSEGKRTCYHLGFLSHFGKVEVKAKGLFFSEMRLAKVGDFGLGNRKVLKIWGIGEISFILPRPIANSFAINKQKKARRGMKLNSF